MLSRGLGLALALAGCHAFEDLEDCRTDVDCALGERCHPSERFCEVDRGPLVVGASLPLSDELEEFGVALERGLQLAAEQINAHGGVLEREIAFEVRDDAGRRDPAVSNVEALVEGRAYAILGPLTSEQALATQEVTYAARVLQISPTAGAPRLSCEQPARDRYFFRTISTVRRGSAAAIALFAATGPVGGAACSTMAIVHSEDEIGQAYREAVGELFERQGGEVVTAIEIPETEQLDYDEEVVALVEAAPDCALIVALPRAAVRILSHVKELTAGDAAWDDFFWIGTTTIHGQAFLDESELESNDPAEGVFIGDEDTTPDRSYYRALRDAFFDRFPPEDPETDPDLPVFLSNMYDAAMLAALAVQAAGPTADRTAIRDALWDVTAVQDHTVYGPLQWGEALGALARGEPIHYAGASSSIVFDDYGTVSNPTVILEIRGGEFQPVRSYTEEEIDEFLGADADPGDCP